MKTVDCVLYKEDIRGINNIVGYRISSINSEFTLWLSEVHTEYKSNSGYKHCYSLPLEGDDSEEARVIQANKINDIPSHLIEKVKHKMMLIQNGWNYNNYNHKVLSYALTAQYILSQIDIDVNLTDIKLMIVWYWE